MFVGLPCFFVAPSNQSYIPCSIWVGRLKRINVQSRAIPDLIVEHSTTRSRSTLSASLLCQVVVHPSENSWEEPTIAMLPTTSSTTATLPPRSFYRRELPIHSCVALSSSQGRAHFESALRTNHLKSFFPLIEQLYVTPSIFFVSIISLISQHLIAFKLVLISVPHRVIRLIVE
jgi:hypothetical protein